MSAPDAETPAETCAVAGCTAVPVRHLARGEVRAAFPDLPDGGRRAPLCREHYREWKKATKDRRSLDRLGW